MKKLFLFLFTLIFSFSLFVPPVLAKGSSEHIIVGKDQTVDSDFFAGTEAVTVLGTINGDAYVAGGNITFEGRVNGDIIAAGGNITIKGTAQNVRVAGGQITIDGTIERNLTVFGGNVTLGDNAHLKGSLVAGGGSITLSSPVGRGVTIGGGTVIIEDAINGNVYAGVGQLTLKPQANIIGNMTYVSDEQAQIMPGATISGKLTHNLPQKSEREETQDVFLGLGIAALVFKLINMASLLILGLLLIGLAPAYMKRVSNGIILKPWQSLGVGVVTVLLAPIIFIVLLMTVIGIPLALIFLALLLITYYIAKIFVIYLIGEKLGMSLNFKLHMMWFFVIGLLVYEIVVLIPFIGWLVDLAALLLGLGSLLIQKRQIYQALHKEKVV